MICIFHATLNLYIPGDYWVCSGVEYDVLWAKSLRLLLSSVNFGLVQLVNICAIAVHLRTIVHYKSAQYECTHFPFGLIDRMNYSRTFLCCPRSWKKVHLQQKMSPLITKNNFNQKVLLPCLFYQPTCF